MINYNKLRDEAFKVALDHGFYHNPYSFDHYLAHVVAELGEAYNAHRNGRLPDAKQLVRLCHKPKSIRDRVFRLRRPSKDRLFYDAFERCVKDSVIDELADAVICLLSTAGNFELDINNAEHSITYRRMYNKWSFAENAIACERVLLDKRQTKEARVRFAVDYILKWAKAMNYNLADYIDLKMRYNKLRPMFNGKRY